MPTVYHKLLVNTIINYVIVKFVVIRYNKLRELTRAKRRHSLHALVECSLDTHILKGDSKLCPSKLYI